MSIVNARDVLMANTPNRKALAAGSDIIPQTSASNFYIRADGTHSPEFIRISFTPVLVDGPFTFSCQGANLTNVTATTADITFADMGNFTALVSITATNKGAPITRTCIVGLIKDGANGTNGANGTVSYTWVKYADNATGSGLSDDPTGKAYIGLSYNKNTPVESTNPSDYAFSQMKGDPGQSIKGDTGANGVTYYTWVKYSDNADGTGLYDTPNDNTMYLGLAVNKNTPVPSTNKTDYVWSKFRGAQGVPGVGTPGARGAGHFYVNGSSWSDTVAEMATPGASVINDVVTISNGSTYALTKSFDGSNWVAMGAIYDGNLFVTGSINGAAIKAGTLTIFNPDGSVALAAGGKLNLVNAAVGTVNNELPLGGNLLYNGDFSNGMDRWGLNSRPYGEQYDVSTGSAPKMAGLDWTLNRGVGEGTNTLEIQQPNTATGNSYFELLSDPIPIQIGKRYCISAYTGAHRCTVDVFAYTYDVNGNIVGSLGAGMNANYGDYQGGQYLGGYKRIISWGDATVGAYMRVAIRKYPTATGPDSWMMVCRVQAEEISSNAGGPSPWKPPGISAAAYGGINTALAQVANIANDGILDRSEKAQLRTEWASEDAAWNGLRNQAAQLGVDYSGYDNAHNAASSYLVAMVPGWADTSQDTVINRQVFINTFNTMYKARAALDAAIKAKTATTADFDKVNGRYEDPSNLVKKSQFADGASGGWFINGRAGGEVNINGSNNAAVPSSSQLVTSVRDCLENGNTFPVTPGERIYFSTWMSTESTSLPGRFGFFVFNKSGQVILYVSVTKSPLQSWSFMQDSTIIPDGGYYAIPWVQQDGFDYNNDFAGKNYLRVACMWIGRHARGATIGATFGVDLKGYMDRNNIGTYIASAAIGSALIDNLSTANYAENGYGQPTAGARMASWGTALKVASNSMQVGQYTFSDYWFRLLQGIDGSIAAGRVIWRGNNDITTRGGAPNIARLLMYSSGSVTTTASTFQQVFHRFSIGPYQYSDYTDNLDSMSQIHIQYFSSTSATSWFTEVRAPCPSRCYDGNGGSVESSITWGWRYAGTNAAGPGYAMENGGHFSGALRVRISNSYGWSATQDFGPASNGAFVGLPTTTIVAGGSSGGGGSGGSGGGGGGYCPAPWVKIRLVGGKEIDAMDLTDGVKVAAVDDNTMTPLVSGGTVRDVTVTWASRFQVKLTDGSVSEWSEKHRFYVIDKGWVHIENLLPGDHIAGQKECIVESIFATGRGQVVAFRVEGAGTYFGGGMLCHNIKAPIDG